MRRPLFQVDFNELIEEDLVGLCMSGTKATVTGESVMLSEGLAIDIYDEDIGDNGEPDNLIASGVVERNSSIGGLKHIKWCCRIDSKGIRHESDLA